MGKCRFQSHHLGVEPATNTLTVTTASQLPIPRIPASHPEGKWPLWARREPCQGKPREPRNHHTNPNNSKPPLRAVQALTPKAQTHFSDAHSQVNKPKQGDSGAPGKLLQICALPSLGAAQRPPAGPAQGGLPRAPAMAEQELPINLLQESVPGLEMTGGTSSRLSQAVTGPRWPRFLRQCQRCPRLSCPPEPPLAGKRGSRAWHGGG